MKMRLNTKAGMTILFAVLLITIVFAVTFILFNITLRQILLSLVARDSRYAYYAADSGLNCASYWDWNQTFYPVDPNNDIRPFGYFEYDMVNHVYTFFPAPTGLDPSVLSCDGNDITVYHDGDDIDPGPLDPYGSYFTIYFSPDGSGNATPCAYVTVKQYFEEPGNSLSWRTKFVSTGYNVSDVDGNHCPPEPPSDRTVERQVTK